MKIPISFVFLMFAILHINAQPYDTRTIEHGLLFSTRIDSDDDLAFKEKGFGIEGGYYYLKKLGSNGMISLDFRLAYAQSERNFKNVVKQKGFSSYTDTIITQRSGIVFYRNLSVSIPIKYRHQLNEEVPIFILIGFNPYFNLLNNTQWKFDEFKYDTANNMNVSEKLNQEEDLKQSFYSRDLILAGFGYIKDSLMFDIYFSGGTTSFDNNFITGMDKLSIVLNAYYRLN